MTSSTLFHLAEQTGALLLSHHFMLATAESCTGGGLAYWLTSIPGSSAWFEGGFITYSNTAKENMLSVSADTLQSTGAVSEATARAMAEGVLRHTKAHISVAITGIAGPDGGSAEKPVGTVWFAWAGLEKKTFSLVQHFSGNRMAIREQAIAVALEKLLDFLKFDG